MTTDYNNAFSTNNELLVEVCQFVNCVSNKIISSNENFMRRIDSEVFDSFNALLVEEINEYKVYDC